MVHYSHMLLITLFISMVWGLVLFIVGMVCRFNQAMLVNNFIEGLGDRINPKACVPPNTDIDVCPYETEFSEVDLGDWANKIGGIAIVTGTLVLVYSSCGIAGTVKKIQPLLISMFVFIVGAVALEHYLLTIVLNKDASFHEDAKDELIEKIISDYEIEGKNVFTKMLNAIMLTEDCCGVKGPEDFNINHTITLTNGQQEILESPPACCLIESMSGDDAQKAFTSMLGCTTNRWSVRTSQKGCYDEIHKRLYQSYGGALIGFLLFLIVWEAIQGIVLFLLLLRPPPKNSRKSRASSMASGTRPSNGGGGGGGRSGGQRGSKDKEPVQSAGPAPQKFVPFAKISSFVHSDVNRIKSTEIW